MKKLKKIKKIPKKKTVIGTITVHPRGFGFVSVEGLKEDIFIPKSMTNKAVDKDTVEVKINPYAKSSKGPDGQVVSIIKRGRTHLTGIVVHQEKNGYLAHIPLLGKTRSAFIKKPAKPLEIGERVYLKILKWNKQEVLTEWEKSLGHILQASKDIDVAIKEYSIPSLFPKQVKEEAKKYGKTVSKVAKKDREDLTGLTCITIDPDTAKDYDDALSISKDPKGNFHLGVHIADVSYYVKEGTLLDLEAKKRANSTYFPGKCVPMLPEELSNNLCSLKEKVIRLAISVQMQFDPEGNLLTYSIKKAFIKSRKRLTYSEAKEILEGKRKSPYSKVLHQMEQICALLKKKRNERGSVDLAMPELILEIQKNGEPKGFRIEEYHIAHQIVEEFMLKANEIVATDLSKKGIGSIYRIHEAPTKEALRDFYSLVRHYGFSLPNKPKKEDIQTLFQEIRKTDKSSVISIAFIRSMKLAIYSDENIGHFGLSLEYYSHFTSPIRRYTDLIVHRLLFKEAENADLKQISEDSSTKERNSFKAESSVLQLKKLRLLDKILKKNSTHRFEASVTKVTHFGIFFEIIPLRIEGFIHVQNLGREYYEYQEKSETLVAHSSGKYYRVGTPLFVYLDHIDFLYQETEWSLAR